MTHMIPSSYTHVNVNALWGWRPCLHQQADVCDDGEECPSLRPVMKRMGAALHIGCSKAQVLICSAHLLYHSPLLARFVHESEAVPKDDGAGESRCQANRPYHYVRNKQRRTSQKPVAVLHIEMILYLLAWMYTANWRMSMVT
jgi:hypothetical protein